MKKKIIKGILLDTTKNTIQEYDLNYKSYKDFYPILDCDCFDIATRKFGNHYIDIFCDDEGLLKVGLPMAVSTSAEGKVVEQIVGNVFLCGHDEEGDSISLTKEEIEDVNKCIRYYYDTDNEGNDILRVCLVAEL